MALVAVNIKLAPELRAAYRILTEDGQEILVTKSMLRDVLNVPSHEEWSRTVPDVEGWYWVVRYKRGPPEVHYLSQSELDDDGWLYYGARIEQPGNEGTD